MRIKTLILFQLIIILFWYPLFSRIESQIQGVVLEKGTEKPIEGAWINLFKCSGPVFKDLCSSLLEVKSNSKGEFKIEELGAGQYFLVVVHRDYVVYGPADELLDYLGGNTKGELNQYVQRGYTPDFFENNPERNFILKEGMIKHFIIQLERAAGLEVTAKIKLPSGTSIYEGEVGISLIPLNGEKSSYGISFTGGDYKSRCLPALGDIILEYKMRGYSLRQLSGINLRSGQNTRVELLFDFTTGQVVHGIIISKQLKHKLSGAYIELSNLNVGPTESFDTYSDERGEFWFAGMEPGEYTLYIHHISAPSVREILKIDKNEKIELIKEL